MSLGCGLNDSDKETLEKLGLISNHSYGIISAASVIDTAGNEVDIIKLRNPWGSFEWQGPWSDTSELWTEEAKKELNVTVEDDGCFWMDIETIK